MGKAKGNVADTEKVMQGPAHKPLQAGDGISYSDAAVFPHVADETCSLFRILNTRNKKTTKVQEGREKHKY